MRPDFSETFLGLGMPKPEDPKTRGDFIVQVAINFPLTLTGSQKRGLRRALPMEFIIETMRDDNVIEEKLELH
jgi:DnaJ-class molecular chaperone